MAKKSMIERERKRERLVVDYAAKRSHIKQEIKNTHLLQEKLDLHRQLQQLPRNSALVIAGQQYKLIVLWRGLPLGIDGIKGMTYRKGETPKGLQHVY